MITTYKLSDPVKFGSELISELVFQPMKARHLRAIKSNDLDMGILLDLASKLTGQPTVVIDELSVFDALEVQKIIAGFFNPGRKTGEKDSAVSPAP